MTEQLTGLQATKAEQEAEIAELNEIRAGCITRASISTAWRGACTANIWPYQGTSKCYDGTFAAGYVLAWIMYEAPLFV